MIQAVFFTLFIITLLAGAFAYFSPSHKFFDPMKFFMQDSGYNTVDEQNKKSLQQLGSIINKGLNQTRQLMDENVQEEHKIFEALKDKQQEARQKAQEQMQLMQQRIADQKQRMSDQQNR